jgi:hypothetical protein
MLYDPRWEQKNKNTLLGLIAWLETQDPNTRYDYCDASGCVVGNYLKSLGVTPFDLKPEELDALHPCLNSVACGTIYPLDWTYGGALKRARAAL